MHLKLLATNIYKLTLILYTRALLVVKGVFEIELRGLQKFVSYQINIG